MKRINLAATEVHNIAKLTGSIRNLQEDVDGATVEARVEAAAQRSKRASAVEAEMDRILQ